MLMSKERPRTLRRWAIIVAAWTRSTSFLACHSTVLKARSVAVVIDEPQTLTLAAAA
jgi:hypothetical protein